MQPKITKLYAVIPGWVTSINDGDEHWMYSKAPWLTNEPHGRLGISRDKKSKLANIAGIGAPTRSLQGYMGGSQQTLRAMLSSATSLSGRQARERIDRSNCVVVDFLSPYGDGTIWFDPERGFNIAKAAIHRETGHLGSRGTKIPQGYKMHYLLDDVSFSQVDGVWIQTGATVLTDTTYSWGHEVRRLRPRITNIRFKPNLDQLDLFTKKDIEEGADAGYIGEAAGKHIWRNGKVVLKNNSRR